MVLIAITVLTLLVLYQTRLAVGYAEAGHSRSRPPANCTGEQRSLKMGSVRMFRPPICTRKVA